MKKMTLKEMINKLNYLNRCHIDYLIKFDPNIIYGIIIMSQIVFNDFIIETLELFIKK